MNKKQLEKEISSLSAHRDTLATQQSELSSRLDAARAELGTALLDGQETAAIEKTIASLEIKVAGMGAAITQAGERLARLRADLNAEEIRERRAMINKRVPVLRAELYQGMSEIQAGIARVCRQAGEIDKLLRSSQQDGLIQYQGVIRGLFSCLNSWRGDNSGPAHEVRTTLQRLDGLASQMDLINNPPLPGAPGEPEFREIRVHIERTPNGDIVYPEGMEPFRLNGSLVDRNIWLPGDRFVNMQEYEKIKEAATMNPG